MSAYTLPQTFTSPEHVAIDTVRFDQEAAGHAYFDSFDGDVIMSEASRALGYGSAIPDVDPPLAFVSPQDLLLPPMIVVAPPKRTLSEVDDTPDLSEQKRRTRRPNTKPMERGNNPFGHLGTLRCKQCRRWRQKCVFEAVELPCTQCAKKGLPCGKADKVLGPKRQFRESEKSSGTVIGEIEQPRVDLVGLIVPLPLEERITSFEEICISYYFEKLLTRQLVNNPASFLLQVEFRRRFALKLQSKAVTMAMVLNSIKDLQLKKRSCVDACQELEYLGRFYRYMQSDIKDNRALDLVYACISHCDYLNLSASTVKEMGKHAMGLFMALNQVTKTAAMQDNGGGIGGLGGLCFASFLVLQFSLYSAYNRDRNAENAGIVLSVIRTAIESIYTRTTNDIIMFIPLIPWILLDIVFENLKFRSLTTVERGNLDVDGHIYSLLSSLYDAVRSIPNLWTWIHEEFCNSESQFLTVPSEVPDWDIGFELIFLQSELYFLSLIFDLGSPHIKTFGQSDTETALLLCRTWPLINLNQNLPRLWSMPQHALFLAGLVLAKVTDYVRGQLQEIHVKTILSDGTPVASLVLPFFDEASRLPCITQVKDLRFRGIDGILHFLSIWPHGMWRYN